MTKKWTSGPFRRIVAQEAFIEISNEAPLLLTLNLTLVSGIPSQAAELLLNGVPLAQASLSLEPSSLSLSSFLLQPGTHRMTLRHTQRASLPALLRDVHANEGWQGLTDVLGWRQRWIETARNMSAVALGFQIETRSP